MKSSSSETAPLENLGIEPRLREQVIDEEIEHPMAALALAPGAEPTWIIGSGASKHFTGNPHVFPSLEVSHNPFPVLSAGGQTHAIHGRGNVDFELPSGKIKTIKDFFFKVPGLHKNLVSIGQTADKGHMIVFDTRDKCIVKTKSSPPDIIALGARDKGSSLYNLSAFLSNLTVNSLEDIQSLTRTWHERFGHISYQSLHNLTRMSTGIPLLKIKPCACEICQKAHQSRLKFPQESSSRASNVLELIHSNVCGPLPVTSHGGSRYFVIFVDDFSRKIWIFLLKTKNQVFDKFKIFKLMIEKQMGKPVKFLRSDNGGEYISKEFSKFCQ